MAAAKEALNADENARDVTTAQKLLKKHQELGDDIRAHEDEFREVTGLGGQLLQRNSTLTDVAERLELLNAERQAVIRGWDEKSDWLRQCLDLQLLHREADQIEASTSSHEVFLSNTDLGVSHWQKEILFCMEMRCVIDRVLCSVKLSSCGVS
jgi:spectrin beta